MIRKTVRVEVVDTDRYGRTVAHVYLGDRHINREIVREGYAWVYLNYVRDRSLLDQASLGLPTTEQKEVAT